MLFSCPNCPKFFDTESQLNKHEKIRHNDEFLPPELRGLKSCSKEEIGCGSLLVRVHQYEQRILQAHRQLNQNDQSVSNQLDDNDNHDHDHDEQSSPLVGRLRGRLAELEVILGRLEQEMVAASGLNDVIEKVNHPSSWNEEKENDETEETNERQAFRLTRPPIGADCCGHKGAGQWSGSQPEPGQAEKSPEWDRDKRRCSEGPRDWSSLCEMIKSITRQTILNELRARPSERQEEEASLGQPQEEANKYKSVLVRRKPQKEEEEDDDYEEDGDEDNVDEEESIKRRTSEGPEVTGGQPLRVDNRHDDVAPKADSGCGQLASEAGGVDSLDGATNDVQLNSGHEVQPNGQSEGPKGCRQQQESASASGSPFGPELELVPERGQENGELASGEGDKSMRLKPAPSGLARQATAGEGSCQLSGGRTEGGHDIHALPAQVGAPETRPAESPTRIKTRLDREPIEGEDKDNPGLQSNERAARVQPEASSSAAISATATAAAEPTFRADSAEGSPVSAAAAEPEGHNNAGLNGATNAIYCRPSSCSLAAPDQINNNDCNARASPSPTAAEEAEQQQQSDKQENRSSVGPIVCGSELALEEATAAVGKRATPDRQANDASSLLSTASSGGAEEATSASLPLFEGPFNPATKLSLSAGALIDPRPATRVPPAALGSGAKESEQIVAPSFSQKSPACMNEPAETEAKETMQSVGSADRPTAPTEGVPAEEDWQSADHLGATDRQIGGLDKRRPGLDPNERPLEATKPEEHQPKPDLNEAKLAQGEAKRPNSEDEREDAPSGFVPAEEEASLSRVEEKEKNEQEEERERDGDDDDDDDHDDDSNQRRRRTLAPSKTNNRPDAFGAHIAQASASSRPGK